MPEPNDTQNLGSSTKRFKKLYLSDEINSLGNLTIGGTSALIGVVTLSDDLICAPIVIDKSASKITSSTGAIGYETTNNSTVVGSVGTMQLPYISDTTASPTDGELDGWFGDTNGCVGIQFTGTAHRIWVKSDSEWVKNFLT